MSKQKRQISQDGVSQANPQRKAAEPAQHAKRMPRAGAPENQRPSGQDDDGRRGEVFDAAPQAMVIVSADGTVVHINRSARALIGRHEGGLEGQRWGQVSRCVHAQGGSGCGTNEPCGPCVVRKSVTDTVETGRPVNNAECHFATASDGTASNLDLLITTTLLGSGRQRVLLTLADVTDIKKAQAQSLGVLQKAQERFRMLVEHVKDALFMQIDGKFAYLNPAAVRLFGAESAEQLIGQPILDRVRPDVREKVREHIRLLNEEQQAVPTIEETYLRLDGTIVPVEVSAAPIEFAGRRGAAVFARDITERKAAEAALRESEQKYRELFDHVPSGIFKSTLDGQIHYVNPAYAAIFGYDSPEELTTIVNRECVCAVLYMNPDERPRFVDAALASGQWERFENRYRRKDGSEMIGTLIVSVQRSASGQTYVTGFVDDITQRKAAQAALQESERKYRLLAESTADVLWVVDMETLCFRYVSPSCQRLVGWTPGELIGQSIEKVFTEQSLALTQRVIPERIAAFRAGGGERLYRRDDSARARRHGCLGRDRNADSDER